MRSYLVDRKNKDELAAVEKAYMELFDPALLCAPDFPGPSMGELRSGRFKAILCRNIKGLVVGAMCIKTKENGIYYPVMKGGTPEAKAAVLESMVACAQNNFDTLEAYTTNEFIHELARKIDRPMTYDNFKLTWEK